MEKLQISLVDPMTTLNKRNEIVAKCTVYEKINYKYVTTRFVHKERDIYIYINIYIRYKNTARREKFTLT